MTKSQRLLEVMISINARKKFTVDQLAQEFGVSYRTMHRYLQELSALGMPLYAEPGKHGGYSMLNKSTLPPKELQVRSNRIGNIVVKPKLLLIGIPFTAPHSLIHSIEAMVSITWAKLLNRAAEMKHILDAKRGIGVQLPSHDKYQYMAAYEVHELSVPEGMVSMIIPSQSYFVFNYKGSFHRRWVQDSYQYVLDYLLQQGFSFERDKAILEIYEDINAPDSMDRTISIHLPIS
ncbi:GyrI-like domain-containing protein [Paenibacillus ginsengarvi]|uniref:GyrI-like domain-containing protein n=1 Tax=Paenibacillus ginsengarvi TaxID=400777 RepID=UPI001315A0FC|nr:GyrI-like domain-containing protein [Paenibacillus ginsengarvi]